ncbi:MAG: cupin domain-containing protein [Desulforhabdus sp.]|jgi:cupin 2 domain-containing protein|nr:cupin domain-containing protein [Desulforhabdus sp.]
MVIKNIFTEMASEHFSDELIEHLVMARGVRIERIVSNGHSSPEGFWYDQEQDEWVMVLKGSAGLLFEGSDEVLKLNSGDWIDIPAHKRHRVEWTDSGEKTIWLAVHYNSNMG